MPSINFSEDLKEEMPLWEQEQLVTKANAKKILKRYAVDEPKKAEKKEFSQERLTKTLIIIASIVIGIGVLLYVASNWQHMTSFVKTLILVLGTLVTLIAGHILKEKWDNIGQGFLLLSTLIYGASIFLISQIYHISGVHTSTLFFLWLLGTFAVAYLYKTSPAYFLSALILAIWYGNAVMADKLAALIHPILFFGMLWLGKKELTANVNTGFFVTMLVTNIYVVFMTFTSEYDTIGFAVLAIIALLYAALTRTDLRQALTAMLIATFASAMIHFTVFKTSLEGYLSPLIIIPVYVAYALLENKAAKTANTLFASGLALIAGFSTVMHDTYWPSILVIAVILLFYVLELKLHQLPDYARQLQLLAVTIAALTFAVGAAVEWKFIDFVCPLVLVLALLFTYRERSIMTLIANVAAVLVWVFIWFFSYADISNNNISLTFASGLFFALAYGLLLLGLGNLDKKFRIPYWLLGGSLASVSVFVLSFKDVLNGLTYTTNIFSTTTLALFVIAFLLGIAGIMKMNKLARIWTAFGLLGVIMGFIATLFPAMTTLLMNILFFAGLILALYTGFASKNQVLFNATLLGLAIYLLARYFDIAWGLLDRGLFFIITGVILLVGAIMLEAFRKATINKMKERGMK